MRCAPGQRRLPILPLVLAGLASVLGCATPVLYAPATGLLHADSADDGSGRLLLSVTGRGFGPARAGAAVRLRGRDGRLVLDAPATDPARVLRWSDERIVLEAPRDAIEAAPLALELVTPFADGVAAEVALFTYRHAEVPRTDPFTNPSPLAVAVDGASGVWVNEEFHTQVKRLDASGTWSVYDLPQPPGPGIFAALVFGDASSRAATLGESIVIDPEDRAWLTESGTAPYLGPRPNHARIARVDRSEGVARIWHVPGDANGVVGLDLDPATGRVWFTQARRARQVEGVDVVAQEARLTSFDPRTIPPDAAFDFAPRQRCEIPSGERVGQCSETRHRRCLDDHDCVLAERVCAPGSSDDRGCFREHPIPTPPGVDPLWLPGPLLRHSDGTIWYSGYWGGNYVGRFDPRTETFQRFPLARPPGEASCDRTGCTCFAPEGSEGRACPARCCLYLLLGRGPWGLVEDADGGVAFCSQEGGAVSVLPQPRFDDSRCASLDASGANPCVIEHPLPEFDPTTDQMHSLARDDAGNLWFGQGRSGGSDETADGHEDAARGASIGYVQAGTGRVILLPPISLYRYTSSGAECRPRGEPVAFLGAGIAFDPRTRSIWFADFCRKRLGQIVPQPPPAPR